MICYTLGNLAGMGVGDITQRRRPGVGLLLVWVVMGLCIFEDAFLFFHCGSVGGGCLKLLHD